MLTMLGISASLAVYCWLKAEAELRQYFAERGIVRYDVQQQVAPVVHHLLRLHFGTDPLATPNYVRIDHPTHEDFDLLTELTVARLHLVRPGFRRGRFPPRQPAKEITLNGLRSDCHELIIEGGSMTGSDVVAIRGLSRLRRLKLFHVSIDVPTMHDVCTLSQLRELEVYHCADGDESHILRDVAFEKIANLRGLRRLRLDGLWITDATVQRIASLQQLEYLNLHRCHHVTNASVRAISRLPRLRELWLAGRTVNDDAVSLLTTLDTLKRLRPCNTQITSLENQRLYERSEAGWLPVTP